MVDDGSGSTKILYTFTDRSCSTGDYFIKTDDGRVWKASQTPAYPGTGTTFGKERDGRIYPR